MFITGVENKATGDSNVNASPGEERRDWGTIAASFHDFHGNTTSIVLSCFGGNTKKNHSQIFKHN